MQVRAYSGYPQRINRFFVTFKGGQVQKTGPASGPVSHLNSGRSLEFLRVTANSLLMAGNSTNTQKAYNNGLKSFNTFRSRYNLQNIWPVPLNHLIWFISYHHIQGSAHSTISNYLSGISYNHKIKDIAYPTKSFIYQKC